MHCVFDSLCEMHSLVVVLNRSKVKATFETAFEIVFETFHATFNVFVVKPTLYLRTIMAFLLDSIFHSSYMLRFLGTLYAMITKVY